MKTLLSILTILTLLATTPAYAGHDGAEPNTLHDHSKMEQSNNAACKDKINVKVDGLVCDFCARALEKVFGKRDDVEGIRVDLDKGSVVVAMKPSQSINDETLTNLITDSGYNVRGIDKGC